jgi:ribonuclease R
MSFPKSVLAEAEASAHPTCPTAEDWRRLPLITIDPADARDHDDAFMPSRIRNTQMGS